MENKNTIIENIASLKAEQAELTDWQNNFEKSCNEEKKACYASCKKYFSEAKACLEKTPQIIKPIADKFTSILSKAEGALCLNGKRTPSASFNYTNCFDVFQEAQTVFVANTKIILTSLSTLQLSEQTMKMLEQLCSSYNTIFDFYKNINDLFQRRWDDKYQALCLKKASAEKKLAEIPRQIEELEAKLQVYEEEQQKLRGRLLFSCQFPMAESFTDSVSIPIAYREEDGEINSLLEWELNKENVLCIKAARKVEKSADLFNLLKNIACHFINSFPAGATRIMICDLCGDWSLRHFSARLAGEKTAPQLIYGYSENKEFFSADFDDTMNTTTSLITARTSLYESIYEFNAKNPKSFSPPLLVIINGFTKEDSGISKTFINNIPNGTRTGVYYLVTQFESQNDTRYMRNDRYGFDDAFGARVLKADGADGSVTLSDGDGSYIPTKTAASFDVQQYSKFLYERISSQTNAIDLKNIIEEYKRDDTDFSEELRIPIGRSDTASIKTISFSSKDSSAHCVVAGATGKGKSSLLQAIVLGGAYHYSPDELEFYLIDMKNGAAFYKKEGYDYSKLKHVRMMATNCKSKDIRDFIGFIKDTKTHCSEASDIVSYNKNRSGSEKMKRSIIIIDEYTWIDDDECIADLEKIAAQGRSFGVSLILTSQNTNGSFSKVLEKISSSIEFENIKLGELIERDGKCRISKNEALYLSELKGNCLGRIGMSLSKFRVAYTPDQNELIKQINEKYGSYHTPAPIIIGHEARQIKPFNECNTASSIAPDGSVSVTLGKNLFGADIPCTMSDKTGSLLLLGDSDRAQNVEYSFMTAMNNEVSMTDKKVFHLNFGQKNILGNMKNACANYVEMAMQPLELLNSVRSIYKIYEDRKQEEKESRRAGREDTKPMDPILVVLHNCAEYRSWLEDGMKEEKEKSSGAFEPQPVNAPSAANATGVSVKMPDLDHFDLTFSQFAQAMPEQNLFFSPRSHTEYDDLDPAQMLLEVLKNGAEYHIYFIVHISDIEKVASGLFDASISSLFGRTIIIPEICAEKQACKKAKADILFALERINKDKLKNSIEKSGDMTEQELYRCYYVIGNSYTQIIPYEYEWR